MPLPKFLHPLTPDSKRPKITFVLAILLIFFGFIYFAQTGRNGNASLFKQTPPQKDEPGAYHSQNQQLIREVYNQGADNQTIQERNSALEALKNQQGNSNPEANRAAEKAINQQFDKERTDKLDQQRKVSDFEERLKTFMQKPHTEAEIQQFKAENAPPPDTNTGWKTIAELIAEKQLQPKSTTTMSGEKIHSPTQPSTPQPQNTAATEYKKALDWDNSDNIPNFLPLHAVKIPCILLDNIKTNQLKQRVTAAICQDVVFAHRIQLRAYSGVIVGEVASNPVGDTLDIHFDTIVFADGTELPISGTAYSPEDPRYPGQAGFRGLHGKLVTPPLYTYILSFLGNAATAGAQQYLNSSQNSGNFYGYGSTNQFPNGSQNSTTTTTTVTNGNETTTTQTTKYSPLNSLNPNWKAQVGVATAQSGIAQLNQALQDQMEQYKPYVEVRAGTPVWIDLDQTININARRLNGVIHAQLLEAQAEGKGFGLPQQPYYSQGDARYNGAQQINNPQLSANGVSPSTGNGPNNSANSPNNNQLLQQMQQLYLLRQQLQNQQPAYPAQNTQIPTNNGALPLTQQNLPTNVPQNYAPQTQ